MIESMGTSCMTVCSRALNFFFHYDEYKCVYHETILNNVNDDKCMNANAYMLPRVICEWYIRLCHKNSLR